MIRGKLPLSFLLALAIAWGSSPAGGLSSAYAGDRSLQRYELADLEALEVAFVKLAERVRPSVVAIRTYRTGGPQDIASRLLKRPHSQGSGFIFDSNGYIATNRHVIEGADTISVILNNGAKYEAEPVQDDPRLDLAVIKIDAEGLSAAEFGNTTNLKVNQWVFACGNPFGLANDDGRVSITFGVISALSRQMTQRLVGNSNVEYYGNMIETSATINPGSSGGPLFNLYGEVIGVVTAIETSSGVSEGHGFAIRMDRNSRRVLDLLKAGDVVRYGFLGVIVRDVDPLGSKLVVDSRVFHGALLQEVNLRNGPADRAGLKKGDIVIEYDDQPVENSDHLVRLVGFTPVGATVPITYLRRGVKRQTRVTVADRFESISRAESRE